MQKAYEDRLPKLVAHLGGIPDFYMEIKWEIQSWIPLVGKLAPSDTFKIWKKGGQIRFDSYVRGMNNMSIQKVMTQLHQTRYHHLEYIYYAVGDL